MIPVREFTNGADVLAHARQIARLRYAPRPVAPKPGAAKEDPAPIVEKPARDVLVLGDKSDWKAAEQTEALRCRIEVREIIRRVALDNGVLPEELTGQRRMKKLAAIRHKAIAEVATRFPHYSLSQLGQFFGGRDHTSILYALKKTGVWQRSNGGAA